MSSIKSPAMPSISTYIWLMFYLFFKILTIFYFYFYKGNVPVKNGSPNTSGKLATVWDTLVLPPSFYT